MSTKRKKKTPKPSAAVVASIYARIRAARIGERLATSVERLVALLEDAAARENVPPPPPATIVGCAHACPFHHPAGTFTDPSLRWAP